MSYALEMNGGLIAVTVLLGIALAIYTLVAYKRGWFKWDAVNTRALLDSHVLSRAWLFVVRLAICAYALWVVVYGLLVPDLEGELSFYTMWNILSLETYFLFIVLYSVWHHFIGTTHPLVERVLWVLFETNATMVILVDVVVWTILYPDLKSKGEEDGVLNLSSYHMHGVNFLYMAIELVLNKIQVAPAHALFPVLWGLSYGVFSWIYYTHSGIWRYFFLDTAPASAPGWYLGVCALHVVFFFLVFGADRLKSYVVSRRAARRDQERLSEQQYLIADGGVCDDDV